MEDHLLRTEAIAKSYKKKKIVDGVSLSVKKGEVVGLLGPNGAGKTTTFYMVVGLITPNNGKIFFDNREITHMPMYKRVRCGIGYLSQEPSVFRKLSVEENIMAVLETLPLSKKDRKKRLEELLEELRMSQLAKSKAYTLSGGERRRLEITRCLVTNPSFILLDEPFSGVDPIAVFDVQQIIADLKNKGLGILLTDHNVRETLSITDRSYIMTEGKILLSGTAQELINNPDAKKFYLGEKFAM
ncbi:MAG: LPS export ABC transporter ATP-binding protein [Candidatus Omnitrophica bacterium]|nr:LPS export ABC transporter ATP-binding protein [Candidatus Omnitrophota bacterium]MBU4478135.1 LPS export ABC transporter ATP-binding protein [Candidatus Omnitrophota bacterium]MCG2704068.1 LPS export ABC transporter ATP-binding protein [Candidatus Omnitrophota bacterium]